MAIRAIETEYAGYLFRSRLEAKWAVFFDELELTWKYESEGYYVDTPRGRKKYLPDFWLEDTAQWGEVKGHLDAEGMDRLYNLACGMAACHGGSECHREAGAQSRVLAAAHRGRCQYPQECPR